MTRHAYVRCAVAVPLALADNAIAAAMFRVTPGDEAEMDDPAFELAALDALAEWARVTGADISHVEPIHVIETDEEGTPLGRWKRLPSPSR
jgi:hypothetical protein